MLSTTNKMNLPDFYQASDHSSKIEIYIIGRSLLSKDELSEEETMNSPRSIFSLLNKSNTNKFRKNKQDSEEDTHIKHMIDCGLYDVV